MPRKCGQVAGTHGAGKGLASKAGRGDASSCVHGSSSQSPLEKEERKEGQQAECLQSKYPISMIFLRGLPSINACKIPVLETRE